MSELNLFRNAALNRLTVTKEVMKMTSRLVLEETLMRRIASDLITDPKMRQFIEDKNIIEDLFSYGKASRRLTFPEGGAEYFESVKEVEARMVQLYHFWKESVTIEVDVCDDSMVKITFTVKV